jgi:hypothetical protein
MIILEKLEARSQEPEFKNPKTTHPPEASFAVGTWWTPQRAFLAGQRVLIVTLNRTVPMVAHALGETPRHGLNQYRRATSRLRPVDPLQPTRSCGCGKRREVPHDSWFIEKNATISSIISGI